MPSNEDLAKERTDLAEERTDWAEDRTLLANERTYAGWMRTGLAAMALGLGFNAIFKPVEPTWIAKGIAILFVIIGLVIIAMAHLSARRVVRRMNANSVEPIPVGRLNVISGLFFVAGLSLAVVLWIL